MAGARGCEGAERGSPQSGRQMLAAAADTLQRKRRVRAPRPRRFSGNAKCERCCLTFQRKRQVRTFAARRFSGNVEAARAPAPRGLTPPRGHEPAGRWARLPGSLKEIGGSAREIAHRSSPGRSPARPYRPHCEPIPSPDLLNVHEAWGTSQQPQQPPRPNERPTRSTSCETACVTSNFRPPILDRHRRSR
jgi:hypothetical protein